MEAGAADSEAGVELQAVPGVLGAAPGMANPQGGIPRDGIPRDGIPPHGIPPHEIPQGESPQDEQRPLSGPERRIRKKVGDLVWLFYMWLDWDHVTPQLGSAPCYGSGAWGEFRQDMRAALCAFSKGLLFDPAEWVDGI